MASSEDYKKFYELYQVEGVPHGISIVDFCQRNGIVYKHFPSGYLSPFGPAEACPWKISNSLCLIWNARIS